MGLCGMPEINENEISKFKYLIKIDGSIVGGFSEISGLNFEIDVENIHSRGISEKVFKIAKNADCSNVTLKNGLIDSKVLWKWHQKGINKRMGKVDVLIVSGDEKWRWCFIDAYPVKWVGPDLKADSSTIAVETLELGHDGIEKA